MHRRRVSKVRLLLFAIAIAAACPRAAAAAPRAWQPLVLKGAEVPALLGSRIDRLEALVLVDGKLESIPFQVDQRLPDGRYALPMGPHPIAPESPGILGRDDEIAMMIADLGPSARGVTAMPIGAQEVALTDPFGGPARFVYLASVDFPRLSLRRYIDYDQPHGVIESDAYRVGFTRELPTDFALQDRKYEQRANLIDRIKVRIRARVLKLFDFHVTEDDVDNRLMAWRAGPVRIVRALSHSVRLVLGIRSPAVTSEDFFYRDYIDNPFQLRLPWVPRVLFGDIHARIDLDFLGLSGETLMWSGMKRSALAIGATAAERALMAENPPPEIRWIAFRGQGHTVIQMIAPASDLSPLDIRLYFRDDPTTPDPPERVRGEHPGIGYQITGWENLARGRHDIDSMLIVAPGDYDPELLLKELAAPPRVTVTPAH
jgi:hypothetical protein